MPATASNIPPELFEYILEVLMLPDDVQSWTDNFVKADKRELGGCALVCRYWAAMCQARIFRNVILRSREDLRQLLGFLDTPVSRISRYIWDLVVIIQARPPAPWIHLLPELYRKHSIPIEFHAQLEGPQEFRTPLRSIHHALPQTLPPSQSSNIRMLTITTVQFRRFHDLVHLLTELQGLRDLDCTTVTWSGDPPLTQRIPSKRTSPTILSVTMHGCTSDWVSIWLLIGLSRPELPLGRIAQEQCIDLLMSVGDIQRALSAVWTDCQVDAQRYNEDIDYGVSFRGRVGEPETSTIEPETSTIEPETLTIESETSTIELGAGISHTASGSFFLTISLDLSVSFEELSRFTWTSFDEYIFTHNEIRKVAFGFRSRDDMLRFLKDFAPANIPCLVDSGKLLYGIRRDQGHGSHNENWEYATVKSDITKDSGTRSLYQL